MKIFAKYHAAMRVSQIRRQRGMTQEQLANLVGVTQATISRIEAGNDSVTLHLLREIAVALNCEIVDFFLDDRSSEERILVEAFRALPEDRRRGWAELAAALSGTSLSEQAG